MLREDQVYICTLFLLCRFIYRFICSLPGSTFACFSASREHGPRSQKGQEMPKPGARQHKRITACQENAKTKDPANRAYPNNRWPRSAWLTKVGRRSRACGALQLLYRSTPHEYFRQLLCLTLSGSRCGDRAVDDEVEIALLKMSWTPTGQACFTAN